MNGKLKRNFRNDLERERKRKVFLETYGDPIDGLNHSKFECIWYTTWFTIKRILFCFTTLYLWDKPLFLFFVRIILFFVTYLFIAVGHLFEDPITRRLELMNQAIAIFLIDVMILFTAILN